MPQRNFRDWVIASRPWSFAASLLSVLPIAAWLFMQSRLLGWSFDWVNALLSLPMLICMQAAGNLIGDYYDHIRGVDLPGSLNGVRHIQSGKFQPAEVLHYGYAMLLAAGVIGVIILCRSSWSAIWLGVAGVLMVRFYPWLKYHALGDVDVLLGYALLPALGVSFVATGQYHLEVLPLSLPTGLITVGILHANNTRDILNDRHAGIRTLSIQIGGMAAQWLYAFEVLVPYLLIAFYIAFGLLRPLSLITLLSLPVAIRLSRAMLSVKTVAAFDYTQAGDNVLPPALQPIAMLDIKTSQLQMLFGNLYTLSFLILALL